MEPKIRRSTLRLQGMQDPELEFQLLRALSITSTGGAALGECLETTRHIKDLETWVKAWTGLGDQLAQEAKGSPSKSELLGRASMAYRSAEYFANEPRKVGLKSRQAFINAFGFDQLDLPESFPKNLPGYFIPGKGPGALRPTLLILGGFDSSGEELYFQFGKPATERGHNVLIFEGPGQTGTRRLDPTSTFDHAYEKYVTAAFDIAVSRPETDRERISLLGISFGGHFAMRGAAYEDRLHKLILNSPIANLGDYLRAFFPMDPGNTTRAQLAAATPDECPPIQKSMGLALLDRFGVPDFSSLFERLEAFTVSPREIAQITCPTLTMVAKGEGTEPLRQADLFEKGVTAPVTRHTMTPAWGNDTHCGLTNLPRTNQVMLDWIASG